MPSSRLLLLILAGCVFPVLLDAQPVPSIQWEKKKIAPGLIWKSTGTDRLFESRQHLNALVLRPGKHRLGLSWRQDTLLRTSVMAAEARALAAVNAGFFNTKVGGSVTRLRVGGVGVVDSNQTGNPEIIEGVLGFSAPGRLLILPAADTAAWESLPSFLFTGPLLLLDGEPQALDDNAFNNNRHPRTCACTLRNGRTLLLTADGRNTRAQGLSLPELTRLLQQLGCRDAINLDGGGSTTLWIAGQPDGGVVNMPSDNKLFDHFGERPVANAVLVW